jgi:hypothetical protein
VGLHNPTTPSSAAGTALEKCATHSRVAGRSELVIVNLSAHRHTDPKVLRYAAEPVGPANDDAPRRLTAAVTRAVAACGSGGRLALAATRGEPRLSPAVSSRRPVSLAACGLRLAAASVDLVAFSCLLYRGVGSLGDVRLRPHAESCAGGRR